jgi:hypothetical protein
MATGRNFDLVVMPGKTPVSTGFFRWVKNTVNVIKCSHNAGYSGISGNEHNNDTPPVLPEVPVRTCLGRYLPHVNCRHRKLAALPQVSPVRRAISVYGKAIYGESSLVAGVRTPLYFSYGHLVST